MPPELHQVDAGARAEQAVVVVHEAHDAVVEALVVRHVGVGCVDAHELPDQLGDGHPRPHQIVEDVAGRALIPLEDLVLEPRIRIADFREPIGGEGHGDAPLRVAETLALPGATVKSAPGRVLAAPASSARLRPT